MVTLCSKCYDMPEGWMDVNLKLSKCDGCGRTTFCHAEAKKEESEWQL
jgi:hypothetical protein